MLQQPLSEANQAFLTKLMAIDFGPIAFKLMNPEEGDGWTLTQVTRAIEQYRRFLFLSYLYPDESIVPSRDIDRVWHTHILDTAKYREDCELLFGQFIDHWPYFGMSDEAERQALDDAFAHTQTLFAKHFGPGRSAEPEQAIDDVVKASNALIPH